MFFKATERMFDALLRLYDWTLRVSLRFRAVTALVSVALLAGTVYLFVLIPKGFLPSEDQGRFMVSTEGGSGHHLRRNGPPPSAGGRHRDRGSERRRDPTAASAVAVAAAVSIPGASSSISNREPNDS